MSTNCQRCHDAQPAKLLCVCVHCKMDVCQQCTSYCFPNRCQLGVCTCCTTVGEAHLACGRCRHLVRVSEHKFFCDLCASPICASCLPTSFESGRLKCAECCPSPLRMLSVCSGAPVLVQPAVLLACRIGDDANSKSCPLGHPSGEVDPRKEGKRARRPVSSTSVGSVTPTSTYSTLFNKQKLGAGAQGVVYKCTTADGEVVVSKEMHFDDVDATLMESRRRQAERMRLLDHPHLIRYLDVVYQREANCLCVIMPYYKDGDLSQFVVRQRAPVPEVKLCSIVLQIAGALRYLHGQAPPLVHRDIKPDNILLLNEEQVLLMDLDLCGSVDPTASVVRRREVSPTYEYRAPELAHSRGSVKADVFSLGVVTYVLATLPDFPLVRSESGEELVLSSSEWTPLSLERAIRSAISKVRRYRYSDLFTRLLTRMLVHNPDLRPTSAEVVEELQHIMERKLMEGSV